jgi:hypothetical protein
MLHAEQRTQDVCIESRSVGFSRLFRDRAGLTLSPRAIDGNVQTTNARDGLIYQIPHFIFITDVRVNKNGLGSEPLQLGY